jgi:ABC-2 type transport system permease protein
MRGLAPIFKRELASYFATPVAYVFIVIFLALTGVFTFQLGGLFERGQADLAPMFNFLPWLFLFFLPALSMRLWAEERKAGTLELLMTLPITPAAAVVGKFFAAWAFAALALALTFPVWITVGYLGNPDHGAILAGYLGALLLAGSYLAIGACLSALTRSQVIALVLTVVVCFVFLIMGFAPVLDAVRGWLPLDVVKAIASFGFLTRFEAISKGVIDLRDGVFFVSLIAVALTINTQLIDWKKGS